MLNQNTALYGILTFALASPVYASLNCTSHPSCESLGYSKTGNLNCQEGGYVKCPYDINYKKCVQTIAYPDDPCSGFDFSTKPSNATYYTCQSEAGNKYKFTGCIANYCSKDQACYNVCNTGTYPLTAAVANATMNGACTGYTGTSQSACTGSSSTRYKSFTCNANYCSDGSKCNTVCGSSYKYTTAPSNATLSGNVCTGYTGTSQGSCTGSSAARYDSFTCNANYCKSGETCNTVCDAKYKYTTAPSYATLSGETCTGYTGTSQGTCSGSSLKRYTDFTCSSGYKKNSAGTGCEKDCTYANESACESANANWDCTVVSGCYQPTACKSGYAKDGSICRRAYSSCSAYDSSYKASKSSNEDCSSEDIFLTSGWATCYYDCTSVSTDDCDCGDACEQFGESSYDCQRQMECEASCRNSSSNSGGCDYCDGRWDFMGFSSWSACAAYYCR